MRHSLNELKSFLIRGLFVILRYSCEWFHWFIHVYGRNCVIQLHIGKLPIQMDSYKQLNRKSEIRKGGRDIYVWW